jgi:hypothetical protein
VRLSPKQRPLHVSAQLSPRSCFFPTWGMQWLTTDWLGPNNQAALIAPKCNLPGGHMTSRAPFPVKSAHTRCMREDKVPLCDRHHSRMRAEESSFLPKIIFKCAWQDCQRHYGRTYGYFDLLPHMPLSPEQIDPANRQMKVCARRQTHSYMAITRPKNTAPDAKNLWCWYCFECSKAK